MEQMEKMSGEQIKGKVQEFLKNNFLMGKDLSLSDDDSFLEKGIIDSTGILELVSFVEGAFGFRVEDEELMPENFDSLSNITNFVLSKFDKKINTDEDRRQV